MTQPYMCPTCKSNRMRFTIIQQQPQYVRLHPQTGEVVNMLSQEELDTFHQPYRGDQFLVQCGVCGTTESEERFVKMAQHMQTK
ncbi:hypothetical protein EDM56_29685 [Brevibacillus fluminis]|uniref:DNA alkylation repair protein n=1 Tax=Brevibacillus fluminis TaxID=511487 RepID=A0A3M8CTU4_9BACL|nr:hypothetical protein [Brevibacillus fluminis]RNB79210.1 hypothetical protein EDM56_29685 [Brevibacillus fluminis]